MRILKRSIIVLVCLILFASCTKSIDGEKEFINFEEREEITYYYGTPFTGEVFENSVYGLLKIKYNYKDGKRNGLSELYGKNGQLRIKGKYKEGKRID